MNFRAVISKTIFHSRSLLSPKCTLLLKCDTEVAVRSMSLQAFSRLKPSLHTISAACFPKSPASVVHRCCQLSQWMLSVRHCSLSSKLSSVPKHRLPGFSGQILSDKKYITDLFSKRCTISFLLCNLRFLTSATSTSPASKMVQHNLSPFIGKRLMRRQKLKETTGRDQIMFYPANAFATAEEYNLEALRADLDCYGYSVVKLPEDALDALHVEAKHPASDEQRRIFFFREGSVVFWNVPLEEQQVWLQHLRPHQGGSYSLDTVCEQEEQMDYTYTEDRTQLINGDIEFRRCGPDVTQLEMFAFSNALSLSVKLAVWEAMLNQHVDAIEIVLQDLKDGKKIRMSEADVLRKAGEIFTLSHLINLSSDLLDTPDFYWDREDLGRLYNKTCNYLNIPRRTRVINEKLGQCLEIIELLRDHLKDKHHTRLEWMIIVLIAVEVGFAVFHLVEDYYLKSKTDDV